MASEGIENNPCIINCDPMWHSSAANCSSGRTSRIQFNHITTGYLITNVHLPCCIGLENRAPSQHNDRLVFPNKGGGGGGISMLKIRRSRDRVIVNMGIPILVRRHLYIETTARLSTGHGKQIVVETNERDMWYPLLRLNIMNYTFV